MRVSDKAIQLHPRKTNLGKYTWAQIQSGYAGPDVLQMVTAE